MITGRPITQRERLFGGILFCCVVATCVLIAEAWEHPRTIPIVLTDTPDRDHVPRQAFFGDDTKPAGDRKECRQWANDARRQFQRIADGATDSSPAFVRSVNQFRSSNCELRIHSGNWSDVIDVATIALVSDELRDQLPIYGTNAPDEGPSFYSVINHFEVRSKHQFCDAIAQESSFLTTRCTAEFDVVLF